MGTNVSITPTPIQRFVDSNGNALSGGLLFTYQAGTTTKFATYTDSTGNTQNTNPIVLNQRGEASIWLVPTQSYKFVLAPANDTDPPTSPIWTEDHIQSSAAVAVGNMVDEKGSDGNPGFKAGTDFTAGTTNSLPLSNNYGSPSNLWVAFDGTEQGADTYSIGGANNETLTFTAPIPIGTNKVYVKGGTALTVGAPSPGTVTDNSVAANAGIQSSKLSYLQGNSGSVTRTVQSRLQDWASAKDFGAKGDGVTDDSVALQLWLSALGPTTAGFLPAGTYICRNLTYGSNVTIFSAGAVLMLPPTAIATDLIMKNSTIGSGLGVYGNSNVSFFGKITFDGNNTAGGTSSPFSASKVSNIYFENVSFQNYPFIGAAFGGCKDVVFDNVYTTNCGNPAVTSEGGASLWLDSYGGDGTICDSVTIKQFTAVGNNWSAIYFGVTRGILSNFTFRSNHESAIFCNNHANEIIISNGNIYAQTVKNISASGIEFGGDNLCVSNVTFDNIDAAAISLTDVFNATISNIVSSNCVRNQSKFSAVGHIQLIADGLSPISGIAINNHRAWDSSAPATAAVSVQVSGGGVVGALSVKNGEYAGTAWASGSAISYPSGSIDSASQITNNTGFNPIGSFSGPALPSGTPVSNPKPYPVDVYIYGGTVSSVSVAGIGVATSGGSFRLGVGETISVTYSAAPVVVWIGQ